MRNYLLIVCVFFSGISFAQSINNISPDNANDGETLDVTISGLNTSFTQATSTTVSFYFNAGTSTVTAPNSITVNNDQSLTANVTVPTGTYQGLYGITVFNTIDGCMAAPESFLVNGPVAPVLNSISPSSMSPGNAYSFQINGSNTSFLQSGQNDVYFLFSQATNTLTMATNVNATDDENLSGDVIVPANTYGGDYDVFVYNSLDGNVWLTDGVTVNGPQAPLINSVSPSQGNVGGTYTITINGSNTTFTQGSNGVTFFTSSTSTCNLGGMGPRSNGKYHFPIFNEQDDIVSATITPDVINVINDEVMEVTVTFPSNAVPGPVYFDVYNSIQGYMINDIEFNLNEYGLAVKEHTNDVTVYPNPFSDRVTISFDDSHGKEVQMEITSLSGKTVYRSSKTIENGQIELNLESTLSKGVYFLRMVTADGVSTVKKIIKR